MVTVMGVFNMILFVALLIEAIFFFVFMCINAVSFNGVILCVFWLLSCIFVGMAPFKWAGFLESLFKFMSTRIWRPIFIIIVSCNIV